MLIVSAKNQIQLAVMAMLYLLVLNSITYQQWHDVGSALWVALAWLVLLLPFALLHRFVFKGWLSLQLLIGALAVFAKSRYHTVLSEDILLSALISETDLTAEMLSWRLLLWMAVFGVLPVILLWRIPIKSMKWYKELSVVLLLMGTMLGTIAGIFHYRDYHFRDKGQIRDARFMSDVFLFSPVDAEYNAHRAYKNLKDLKKNYSNVEVVTDKYHYRSEQDDLLVVMIIGESTRGDHFALNGYARPTNPLLSQINHLYTFRAQSCDTLTINSVNCLSSPMKRADESREVKQSSFGQVLKHLGYRTEIYSLQTLGGFYGFLQYDTLVSKYQITAQQPEGAKDKALLPYVLAAIGRYHGGKEMVVAHTLGSHQTYADRIAPETAPFQPYCQNPDVAQCSKEALNNAYDNTVVGVDAFLAKIIAALQDKKAMLLYVSDHGESLGEGGYYFHGQPVKTAPPEQFNVPLLLWFSDAYRATPQGAAYAKQVENAWRAGKVLSHDYVFHSILGCAGVVSDNGGIDRDLNVCALAHGHAVSDKAN